MTEVFDESGLRLDFSACGTTKRFDVQQTNPYGMKSVDFISESPDRLYFIEVKNFQHPNAPEKQRKADYEMLVAAGTEKEKRAIFNLEMGEKIKDSLLRQYALGEEYRKEVSYLLFIHLDKLAAKERGMLAAKISGHIPIGLNDKRYSKFTRITFELVNVEQLKKHGITCEEIKIAEDDP